MRKFNHLSQKGLFLTILALVFSFGSMQGQILQKGIKEGTSVVTDPLKTTQQTTKEVVQPIKDVRNEVKAITDAPKQVTREIDNTEKAIDQAGNEVDRAKSDVEKLTGKGDKKGDQKDSTATGTASADDGKAQSDGKTSDSGGKYVPPDYVPEKKAQPVVTNTVPGADPKDVPRPVPTGSRDNKTPSGPVPAETPTVTGGTDPDPGIDPDATATTDDPTLDAANSQVDATDPAGSRYVELSSSGSEKRPKPDYSSSPARIALEKAEHDIETLEDLFKYSNWEGPEREHTVRAIEYALNELQQAIVEIKKMDPGHSTWRFEERYKEMRAAFTKAKQS